jgi:hypothetical protein
VKGWDSSPIDRLCDPRVFTEGEPDDEVICIDRKSPSVIEGVITSPLRLEINRNLALEMNTDDVVIWFTVGEDLGHLSQCLVV